MTMIHFSTSCPKEARKRLQHSGFAWLAPHAHDEVIRQVERGACRVQCTVMYPSPQLEILDEQAKAAILAAIGNTEHLAKNHYGEPLPESVEVEAQQ